MMLAVLSLPSLAFGSGSEPFQLDAMAEGVWLGGHLSYYHDSTGQLNLEEIRSIEARGGFTPVQNQSVSTAFPPGSPTWIQFAVRYPINSSTGWWVLITPDILPTITLYAEQANGDFALHHGGSALPYKQREMLGLGHAFELNENPAGIRHYFIRVTGLAVTRVEVSLWQEKPLTDYVGRFHGFLSYYAGLMSVLVILAGVRALRYRKPLDIAYFCYLVSYELFTLNHNGLPQVSGLVDTLAIRVVMIQSGLLCAGLSFASVTRYLVVWPAGLLWTRRGVWTGAAITLLILAFVAGTSPNLLMEVNFIQAITWILFSGLAGLWAAWRGFDNARLFVVCFLPFIIWATVLSLGRRLDIALPHSFTNARILMTTSAIHLFLLWLLVLSKDARLERAKRQLEQQLSSLRDEMSLGTRLVNSLRHELNRPLNALGALAQKGPTPDNPIADPKHGLSLSAIHYEFLTILENCSEQMRVATLSPLEIKPVDLAGLIQGVTRQFQLKTTDHLVRCNTGDLPSTFPCDPKLIGILLTNLLENALRHSEQGGAVWVTGMPIDADTVVITVTDEGPGIPSSAKERIFERYFQLYSASKEKPGMGLGLFIVRRIAEMHGGSVACESEPGEGATFRVMLRAPE